MIYLLIACVEYQPDRLDDTITYSPDDSAELVEYCDGLDNNGDGEVDEGFGDFDGDGLVDCLDGGSCEVNHSSAGKLAEETSCTVELIPPVEPWNVELLWEFEGVDCLGNAFIVADLERDGASELVYASSYGLQVLSSSGELLWTYPSLGNSPTVFGQVNNTNTVFTINESGALVGLDAQGAELWEGEKFYNQFDGSYYVTEIGFSNEEPIIAFSNAIFSSTGQLLKELHFYQDSSLTSTILIDLDIDGELEVITIDEIFSTEGNILTECIQAYSNKPGISPAMLVLQADDDDNGEVLFSYEGGWSILELDGQVTSFEGDFRRSGLICAGDLTGNGEMEFLLTSDDHLFALDIQNHQLWSREITDPFGVTGCTVFDFDLDGKKEVLFGDEDFFWIFRGADGEVLFEAPRQSNTVLDVPLVADLDGDGSVEIIVNNASYGIIQVYGNVNKDWPPGTQIWPTVNWSGTSHFADGTIPRTADPPWLTTKVWRGQPEYMIDGMDLRVELVDYCLSSCDPNAKVKLSLQLMNYGPKELGSSNMAVYSQNELIGVLNYGDFLDNSWSTDSREILVTVEQALSGLTIVAGDDGAGITDQECDPSNNTYTWRLTDCDQ